MTKSKFYLQFFLILLIFILPPIISPFFASGETVLDFGSISSWRFICLALSILLFLQERSKSKKEIAFSERNEKILKITLKTGEAILTLGQLYINAALFNLIGIAAKQSNTAQFIFPSTPKEFLFCAISLVTAAFFEEALFRGYLPYALKALNKDSKPWQVLSEAVAVLLFAFGHIYNGWLAVLNAFVAGIILRRCAIKTKHIWAGFAAHLVYNVFTLYALGNAG